MKSERIEYIRFDDLNTGILIEGKPYLISYGNSSSFQQVETPNNQLELIKGLASQFRYNAEPVASNTESIKKFSDEIHAFLIDFDQISSESTHLELYLNPSELGLIPFELLLNERGKPKFINYDDKQLVLTRNFREKLININKTIPETPRVLFVHTKPEGLNFNDIPHSNHKQSLLYALRHSNIKRQLTILANPTFQEFKESVLKSQDENNPYTHIHILAHGALILDVDNPADFEYGIAFYSKASPSEYKATTNKEIKELFESIESKNLPYLVNYMICDGANFTNGLKPGKNPVQITFKAGVPIVIGSQFPLSMKGSMIITKGLYNRLFQGDDIRSVLADIRTSLYNDLPNFHDWISLVSYVDLPTEYDFQLLLYRSKHQLSILNYIRDNKIIDLTNGDDFIDIKAEIETSINNLDKQLNQIEIDNSKEELFLENSSLIASAYKRLAEVEYIKESILKIETKQQQWEYIQKAKEWYKRAADRNQSHHWSLVQFISLQTITEGKLGVPEMDYWYAARRAALTQIESDSKSIWPFGTLIELYLLSHEKDKKKVLKAVKSLVKNCKLQNNEEPIKSTKIQISRYLKWWNTSVFKTPKNLLINDHEFLNLVIEHLLI